MDWPTPSVNDRATRLGLSLSVFVSASKKKPAAEWHYLTYNVCNLKVFPSGAATWIYLKGEKGGCLAVLSFLRFVVKPQPIGRPMAMADGLDFQSDQPLYRRP